MTKGRAVNVQRALLANVDIQAATGAVKSRPLEEPDGGKIAAILLEI